LPSGSKRFIKTDKQKQASAGFFCNTFPDADDNIILVPVSVSDPSINPYSNEFYNKVCIIINKLRLKKHHTQRQGWVIFIKKKILADMATSHSNHPFLSFPFGSS
jgi:hypothetical protein